LLLERAGLDAARALHVGDDVVADVEGARRAGVTPVWLNRAGQRWPVAVSPPPLTVQTLLELAQLLE
jgi:putative hydrolase of the HAD superfamily